MRALVVSVTLGASMVVLAAAAHWQRDAGNTVPRVPVVLELFTSEGCSSCPPADALLAELQRTQPIAGVEVLMLSEHVDYWDRLGWKDPFSSAQFTERQQQYAKALGNAEIYTPQVVVDGRFEAVGSDAAAVRRAISLARRDAKTPLTVAFTLGPDGSASARVDVDYDAAAAGSAAWLTVVVAEDEVSSHVRRGENAHRRLRHSGVARHLVRIATAGGAGGDEPRTATTSVPLGPDWSRQNLRVVAFLTDAHGRIVGAGSAALR